MWCNAGRHGQHDRSLLVDSSGLWAWLLKYAPCRTLPYAVVQADEHEVAWRLYNLSLDSAIHCWRNLTIGRTAAWGGMGPGAAAGTSRCSRAIPEVPSPSQTPTPRPPLYHFFPASPGCVR